MNTKSLLSLILCLFLFVLLCLPQTLPAATTGKIAGKVIDQQSGEPLIGANVSIVGTSYGAATDFNGDFYIINIPPGKYALQASMMGYGNVKMENILVATNATTNLTFKLAPTVIEGETVVVTADAIAFKKDRTSSVRNVSSDQIDVLPIENMEDVLEMQAGVVNGHFRGGRKYEVSYLLDGLPVTEAFQGESRTVNIENDVIKDIEIITGTFNAEYGKAMSGIVNAITKDGSGGFHGRVSGNFGNYYTAHNDVFIGLKNSDVLRNKDYKFQLEGP
ncbi:TonB-dependent receptor, partial [candidate division KSB1 bacterium]|nr:TonB-dependent receptor [candidate division KSB1 bacterium]